MPLSFMMSVAQIKHKLKLSFNFENSKNLSYDKKSLLTHYFNSTLKYCIKFKNTFIIY